MSERKYLGIEIGGTKLQLGVGEPRGHTIDELVRADVDPSRGAKGIVEQIRHLGAQLRQRHVISGIGVGFGGPLDVTTGVVTKSHQIEGWDNFPLGATLKEEFGCPVTLDNDCNVAALAEAQLGAGQGRARVFFLTVGTGIGGGFVVDGDLDGNRRPAVSEIGHLRLGSDANAQTTVESVASGWGIAEATRRAVRADNEDDAARKVLDVCEGDLRQLTTKQIAHLASADNPIAKHAIERGVRSLSWAIAQMITLLAPEVVVVGGGVSLIGEAFFEPLRRWTDELVFPPLAGSYEIRPAALGEEVVVHGALLLHRDADIA